MRKSKRYIALIAVLAILSVSVFIGNTTIISNASSVKENSSKGVVFAESEDYSKYKSEFNFNDAVDEITLNSNNYVGGVKPTANAEYKDVYNLSKNESAVFKFNVAKSGAYNLNLVFADLNESSEKYNFKLEIKIKDFNN